MGTLKTKDGTHIYYKDWRSGQPVVFSHSWPLNSDSREGQMLFLASHGYRCIAHDRRGHGRSSQPWDGNEMKTLIVHGGDDQTVPIDAAGRASAKLVKHPVLKVCAGAPHGLTDTHKDQLNADLLAFCQKAQTQSQAR
jgi:pimeloyl-ACP methyl ester carboxylesterase